MPGKLCQGVCTHSSDTGTVDVTGDPDFLDGPMLLASLTLPRYVDLQEACWVSWRLHEVSNDTCTCFLVSM